MYPHVIVFLNEAYIVCFKFQQPCTNVCQIKHLIHLTGNEAQMKYNELCDH